MSDLGQNGGLFFRDVDQLAGFADTDYIVRRLCETVQNGARRGIWDAEDKVRGRAIEKILGQNLPVPYEVIDKWDRVTGVATSIKSIDLTDASALNIRRFKKTVSRYVRELSRFDEANYGGIVILKGQVNSRVLDLAVPNGAATPAQQQALQDLVNYASQRRVTLNIVSF